ncbi:hypothetical protein [Gloeomargarita sp.]
MLVFLIHGVATQSVGYGDRFKKNVKEFLLQANREAGSTEYNNGQKNNPAIPVFYSSFWGHTFKNQTDQLFNWVRSDIKEITTRHPDLKDKGHDIYRYQELREDFIGKFFGDFLTYMHQEKGAEIRGQIFAQFQAFIRDHPQDREVIIVAHSLGTLILWDLLFAPDLPATDPAHLFRRCFQTEPHPLELRGLVTMGSPLLLMKTKQDINFSSVNCNSLAGHAPNSLVWLNLIHASDSVAYPLGSAIQHDCGQPCFLFMDQYIWQFGNFPELSALGLGQMHAGMALGLMDAHNAYWGNEITAKLTALLIRRDTEALQKAQVHTGWRSF